MYSMVDSQSGAESARRSKLRVVIGNASSEGGEPDYFEASIGSPVDSLCSDDFFGDRSVTSNEAFSARRSSHSGRLMSEVCDISTLKKTAIYIHTNVDRQ